MSFPQKHITDTSDTYLIVQSVELLSNVSTDNERENVLNVRLFHQQIFQSFSSPKNVFAVRLSCEKDKAM